MILGRGKPFVGWKTETARQTDTLVARASLPRDRTEQWIKQLRLNKRFERERIEFITLHDRARVPPARKFDQGAVRTRQRTARLSPTRT